MERKSFLDQEPPPGYIAGIGRGATGFVTQADLGSTRKLPISASGNRNNGEVENQFADSELDIRSSLSTENKEDLEAEKIYDGIENFLERKRIKRRKKETAKEHEVNGVTVKTEGVSASIATIADQFKDVKNDLATISDEQWEKLPESGDFTRRNKRLRNELQQQQRFYRNSDMLALGLKDAGATDTTLDAANEELEINNDDDDDNNDFDNKFKDSVNLLELSRTKDRLLEYQLKLGNQKTSTEVDKTQYLENLTPISKYNIGDYQKTRRLLSKLRETSPYNAHNWIASALLEFDARKSYKAKQLIQEGCEKCPKSEEIWLTNLKIHVDDVQTSKVIVADAIKFNYKSLKLWLKAVELEHENLSKIRVLRKALELLPHIPELWLEIIKYEENKEISIKMLQRASEITPDSLDLWIKLSELQDIDESIDTLKNSINHIAEIEKYKIWIKIAKLEEDRSGNEVKIQKYITEAFETKVCDFEEWIKHAEACECDKHVLSCKSIIFKLLSDENISSAEKLVTIAKEQCAKGNVETAGSILMFVTSNYPENMDAWVEFFAVKRNLKEYKDLFLTYEMAIKSLPKQVEIYIMYAKDKIKFDNDLERVRSILADGLQQLPFDQSLWTFAIDFEIKSGRSLIVRDLFENCLNTIPQVSINIWIKRIHFEKNLNEYNLALKIVEEALEKYPKEELLYLEKSEIYKLLDDYENVKITLDTGIKRCINNLHLYIGMSNLYERHFSNLIKSRSILDQALSLHPKSDALHHERILLELNTDNRTHAQRLLSKALGLVPESPLLWCDSINLATKQQIKNIYSLALKNTKDNVNVILTIARDLWKNGKIDRAYQFFKACLEKDSNYGDAYISYYAFLLKFGSKDEMKQLEDNIKNLFEQLHGTAWNDLIKENEKRGVSELQLLREAAVDVSKHI